MVMVSIRLGMSVPSGTQRSPFQGLGDIDSMVIRSFGQSEYGKLAAQKTGAAPQNSFNPFAQQQQQQQTQNNEQPFFTI